MKLKKSKWYGLVLRSRVGNRIVGGLWRFAGMGTSGEMIFTGKGDAGEMIKIREEERRNYLVWEV